jgi:hypothetical protein
MAAVSILVVSLQFAVTNHRLKLAGSCTHGNEISASIKAERFSNG